MHLGGQIKLIIYESLLFQCNSFKIIGSTVDRFVALAARLPIGKGFAKRVGKLKNMQSPNQRTPKDTPGTDSAAVGLMFTLLSGN